MQGSLTDLRYVVKVLHQHALQIYQTVRYISLFRQHNTSIPAIWRKELFVSWQCYSPLAGLSGPNQSLIGHSWDFLCWQIHGCIATHPQTSTNPTKINPWYNDDCKEEIKQCKQALSKFKIFPNTNNFNDIKVFRAKARRTIKLLKRKSWRSYVSKINHKTPIKKVLDMIRKISGKKKQIPQLHTFKHGGH